MSEETTLTDTANVGTEDEILDLLSNEVLEDPAGDDEDLEYEESEKSTEVEESNEDEEEVEEEVEEVEEEVEDPDETWARALGVDDQNILLDDKGNFAGVNIKVDGESETVDMKTLIAGFQTSKHNTHSGQALAEEKRTFEAAKTNAVKDYSIKLDNVSKLSEYMHKTLLNSYEGVDWQALRTQDPAEYAAAYQDFERQKQEIQNIYTAIESERNTEQSQNAQESSNSTALHLQGELQKVVSNNPGWDTPDKVKAAFGDMSNFVLETYDIPPDLFNGVNDARFIEVVKDAMAYRNGKQVTQKKIKQNLPKFQKGKNGTKRKKVSKLDNLTNAARSSSGGRKRALQVDAVAELLEGI